MASVVSPRRGHSTRSSGRRRLAGAAALTTLALALSACAGLDSGGDEPGAEGSDKPAAVGLASLDIIVPADPGGGWDQTGRALQKDLQGSGLAKTVNVTNVGGAGGTVGLASLANVTEPNTLMVTGLVMVGAVETNKSQARIEDTTPIARLTEEPLVIVVPAESKYTTLKELVDDIVANGKNVTVTGGSAGGADHILAGMLLKQAGVPSDKLVDTLNYVAYSGGGESLSALLGNKVSAGISGVGEYAEQVKAGTLRALAVSSPEKSELLPEVPTLHDAGYGFDLTNWRGVLAPADITDEEREALEAVLTELHASDAWQATLEEKGWSDAFVTGADFDDYLQQNIADIQAVLRDIGLVS
ncbi:Bug family tripartite tricarboxylate transporter substrate binding protein [Oerskovia turbata]